MKTVVITVGFFCAMLAFCAGTDTMDILGVFWLMTIVLVVGVTMNMNHQHSPSRTEQFMCITFGLIGMVICSLRLIGVL